MRIGLVRHFKVNHPFPKKRLLSKSEVTDWFAEYDNSENLSYKAVALNQIDWKRCYCSTMIRAKLTAGYIYNGQITELEELRELNIFPRLSDKIKLPFILWAIIVRIKSLSGGKDVQQFENKISDATGNILSNNVGDVLIVSHWFVMRVIRKELIRKGFTGDKFKSDDYGTLYIYENAENPEQSVVREN